MIEGMAPRGFAGYNYPRFRTLLWLLEENRQLIRETVQQAGDGRDYPEWRASPSQSR